MALEYFVRPEIKEITIKIPASNEGKFRLKTRAKQTDFGASFAARTNFFTNQVYLEWQIGYDAMDSDIKRGVKKTELNDLHFIGANKKKKSPFELSELIYHAAKLDLIKKDDLIALADSLSVARDFLDKNEIRVEQGVVRIINGITFDATTITLPTFFMTETPDGTQIEISIQKQQYASGVQPMLYFCIPLPCFFNGRSYIGRPSNPGDVLEYKINKNNAIILLIMLRIFGICSPSHNHDINEILKILFIKLDILSNVAISLPTPQ